MAWPHSTSTQEIIFINITFLSILEMSYRCTLLKTTRYDGKKGYFQQDRSMTARLRPLKEGRFHPSVVIGVDDPFKNTGNNYFGTVYGVLTKSFSIAGRDRLALHCRILYSDKRPEHTERPVWRHQLLSRLLQGNGVHGRIWFRRIQHRSRHQIMETYLIAHLYQRLQMCVRRNTVRV